MGVLITEEQGNTVYRETDGLQSVTIELQGVLYVSGADKLDSERYSHVVSRYQCFIKSRTY